MKVNNRKKRICRNYWIQCCEMNQMSVLLSSGDCCSSFSWHVQTSHPARQCHNEYRMNGSPCSKILVGIPSATINLAQFSDKFINLHWLYHQYTILRALPQHRLSKICLQWSFFLEKFLFAADGMVKFCYFSAMMLLMML